MGRRKGGPHPFLPGNRKPEPQSTAEGGGVEPLMLGRLGGSTVSTTFGTKGPPPLDVDVPPNLDSLTPLTGPRRHREGAPAPRPHRRPPPLRPCGAHGPKRGRPVFLVAGSGVCPSAGSGTECAPRCGGGRGGLGHDFLAAGVCLVFWVSGDVEVRYLCGHGSPHSRRTSMVSRRWMDREHARLVRPTIGSFIESGPGFDRRRGFLHKAQTLPPPFCALGLLTVFVVFSKATIRLVHPDLILAPKGLIFLVFGEVRTSWKCSKELWRDGAVGIDSGKQPPTRRRLSNDVGFGQNVIGTVYRRYILRIKYIQTIKDYQRLTHPAHFGTVIQMNDFNHRESGVVLIIPNFTACDQLTPKGPRPRVRVPGGGQGGGHPGQRHVPRRFHHRQPPLGTLPPRLCSHLLPLSFICIRKCRTTHFSSARLCPEGVHLRMQHSVSCFSHSWTDFIFPSTFLVRTPFAPNKQHQTKRCYFRLRPSAGCQPFAPPPGLKAGAPPPDPDERDHGVPPAQGHQAPLPRELLHLPQVRPSGAATGQKGGARGPWEGGSARQLTALHWSAVGAPQVRRLSSIIISYIVY